MTLVLLMDGAESVPYCSAKSPSRYVPTALYVIEKSVTTIVLLGPVSVMVQESSLKPAVNGTA